MSSSFDDTSRSPIASFATRSQPANSDAASSDVSMHLTLSPVNVSNVLNVTSEDIIKSLVTLEECPGYEPRVGALAYLKGCVRCGFNENEHLNGSVKKESSFSRARDVFAKKPPIAVIPPRPRQTITPPSRNAPPGGQPPKLEKSLSDIPRATTSRALNEVVIPPRISPQTISTPTSPTSHTGQAAAASSSTTTTTPLPSTIANDNAATASPTEKTPTSHKLEKSMSDVSTLSLNASNDVVSLSPPMSLPLRHHHDHPRNDSSIEFDQIDLLPPARMSYDLGATLSSSGRKTPPPPPPPPSGPRTLSGRKSPPPAPPASKRRPTKVVSPAAIVVDEATTARLLAKLNRISMPRASKIPQEESPTDSHLHHHTSAPRPMASLHQPTSSEANSPLSPGSTRPRRASIPPQDMVVDFDDTQVTAVPAAAPVQPPPLPPRRSVANAPSPKLPPATLPLSKPAVDIVINRLGYHADRVVQLLPPTVASEESNLNTISLRQDDTLSPWQRYHKRASDLFLSATGMRGDGNSNNTTLATTPSATTEATTTTTPTPPRNRFQLAKSRTFSESSQRVTNALSAFWGKLTLKSVSLSGKEGRVTRKKLRRRTSNNVQGATASPMVDRSTRVKRMWGFGGRFKRRASSSAAADAGGVAAAPPSMLRRDRSASSLEHPSLQGRGGLRRDLNGSGSRGVLLRADDPTVRYSSGGGLVMVEGWVPNVTREEARPPPPQSTTAPAAAGQAIEWSHGDVWL